MLHALGSHRVRRFERGKLNTEKTAIETPLDHAFLPNEQVFNLDRNGNWDQTVESVGVPQMTVDEHRSVNAVNEYLTVTWASRGPDGFVQTETRANGVLVQAPTVYEYDSDWGDLIRTGLDLDGSGLDPGGIDRITETTTVFNTDAGQWWRETTTAVYDSGSTPTPVSTRRQRLTGYGGDMDLADFATFQESFTGQ